MDIQISAVLAQTNEELPQKTLTWLIKQRRRLTESEAKRLILAGQMLNLNNSSRGLHLGGGLIVARIVDAADLVLGFYTVDRDAGSEWGYLWNVDHPECSYWERVERIMASINPADLPRGGKLAHLGLQVAFLADDTVGIDPRAVAIAVGGVDDRDYEAEQLSDLIEWLTYYRTGRMRC